jgi:hypothetical protein
MRPVVVFFAMAEDWQASKKESDGPVATQWDAKPGGGRSFLPVLPPPLPQLDMSFTRLAREPRVPSSSDHLEMIIGGQTESIIGLLRLLRETELKLARAETENARMQREIDHLVASVSGAKPDVPPGTAPGSDKGKQ